MWALEQGAHLLRRVEQVAEDAEQRVVDAGPVHGGSVAREPRVLRDDHLTGPGVDVAGADEPPQSFEVPGHASAADGGVVVALQTVLLEGGAVEGDQRNS